MKGSMGFVPMSSQAAARPWCLCSASEGIQGSQTQQNFQEPKAFEERRASLGDVGAIYSQQLVEGVLAIRPRLPKDELAGAIRQRLPFERHAFAVRFHVQLLDMRREPRQRLRHSANQPSL